MNTRGGILKSRSRFAVTALFVVALNATAVANAALVSRLNGQAIYDTDLNITWLADANLAATDSFGVAGIGAFSSGGMSWVTAQPGFKR